MAMFRWEESEYLSFIPDVENLPPERFKLVFRFLRTQKRLEDLEDKLERIDSAFKKLQDEWDATYDKFRHLNFRVSKRVKLLEREGGEGGEVVSADSAEPVSGDVGLSLSARQMEANARILARRNRTGKIMSIGRP